MVEICHDGRHDDGLAEPEAEEEGAEEDFLTNGIVVNEADADP